MAAALAAGSSGGADLQPGARALFVGRAYYGCAATVLDPGSDGFTRKVGTSADTIQGRVVQAGVLALSSGCDSIIWPLLRRLRHMCTPIHAVHQSAFQASTGGCQVCVGTCLAARWLISWWP